MPANLLRFAVFLLKGPRFIDTDSMICLAIKGCHG